MTETSLALTLTTILVAGVTSVLYWREIIVRAADIEATLPWFAVIGVAVAVGRLTPGQGVLVEFLRSPTVYVVVAAIVTALWLTFDLLDVNQRSRWTAASGVLVTIGAGGVTAFTMKTSPPRVFVWNAVAVVLAAAVTAVVLSILQWRHRVTYSWLGVGVLFGHVLDVTTTGVGLEQLGATERNPIAAALIQFGDSAAVPGIILFLLVKIAVALLILWALKDDDTGREPAAFLVVAAGAGIIPAIHNLVLFSLAAP